MRRKSVKSNSVNRAALKYRPPIEAYGLTPGTHFDLFGVKVWTHNGRHGMIQWRGQFTHYPLSTWDKIHYSPTIVRDKDGNVIKTIPHK